MIDRDLSGIRDFKGRPLAAAMYEESRNDGRGFAIYPSPLDESAQMRHAYFVYFPRGSGFSPSPIAHKPSSTRLPPRKPT